MADVELAIKIPEELLSEIDDENYQSVISWYATTLYCAIKDGIVLPKGHGKLIDINEITAFRELECNGHDVESLDEFTVIIEADKEDK